MQIIDNDLLKEKIYIEKTESGFTIMCIPKTNTRKKYAVIATGYGSNDNKFIKENEETITEVPDGIAHYLEHKLFEQENGINSLDTLSTLGVSANAYTTNDHTAYLFECTQNYDDAMKELLNYVQNPFFTDENVEREKGIIAQEIKMYDDEPDFKVYLNCMKALYKENPIRIDVAGSIESIKKITKENLYECYENFYIPDNMVIIIVGNFEPEIEIEKIKKQLTLNKKTKPRVIQIQEALEVYKPKIETRMAITTPLFTIGYKIDPLQENMAKKYVGISILLEILFGESTETYQEMYEEGLIYDGIQCEFEYSKKYAHILISGKTIDTKEVAEKISKRIEIVKEEGIPEEDFLRAKRKLYGMYLREFNNVDQIATMFTMEYFKGNKPFDFIENYKIITKEYLENILINELKDDRKSISIINPIK